MMDELALTSPYAPRRLKKCIELRHEIAEAMTTLKRLRYEEDTVLEQLIQDIGLAGIKEVVVAGGWALTLTEDISIEFKRDKKAAAFAAAKKHGLDHLITLDKSRSKRHCRKGLDKDGKIPEVFAELVEVRRKFCVRCREA